MVKLKCRSCGGEVDSDEKARKCRHCNELFPFACAVCDKHLRPPIPKYPIERYYNEFSEPLCAEHYQRECPECKRWFRADENPGFFLCIDCTQRREAGIVPNDDVADDDYDENYDTGNSLADDEAEDDDVENRRTTHAKPRAGCVGVFLLSLSATAVPVTWFCIHAWHA
jgi:hypothetical protein